MRRQPLASPRTLLLVLTLVTAAAVCALVWFGWRLAQQEHDVEARRAQARLDDAADTVVARARAALAQEGEALNVLALSDGGIPKGEGPGLLAVIHEGQVVTAPVGRLLFYPLAVEMNTPNGLSEAERLEFGGRRMDDAARAYRSLATSEDPRLRGEATLGLARVRRLSGDLDGAREAYDRLASLDAVRVTGGPAGLVALQSLVSLDRTGKRADALRQALLSGRWALTRSEFEFSWSIAGAAVAPPADRLLESALEAVVQEGSRGAAFERIMRIAGAPVLVLERSAGGRSAVRILSADWLMRQACRDNGTCELRDPHGPVATTGGRAVGRPVVRASVETGLPVTFSLGAASPAADTGVSERRRFIWAQVALTTAFLVAGAIVIGRAMNQAHQTAQLQAEFVSAVSHEFRSPLTSIRQLSEMLALGRVPADNRRQRYYEALLGETDRLQRLVERLLQFGRLEAGAASQVRRRVDVRTAVEGVRSEFDDALAGRECGILITTTAVSPAVSADPEGLHLALRNLIDNALKYSPGDRPVEIDWSETDGCVAINIRDQGIGIPPAEQQSIFRKFVRGRAAIEGRVTGTGLGLAMVQQIVTGHGGRVEIESQPGRGSTFSMILPLAGEVMTRILVVEDEPAIALGLEDDLTLEGYEVELVSDGLIATQRAKDGEFDLIVLDVMLPGRDGLDVCREVRRRGVRTPILMLTARAHEAEKVLGLELGADDYVTKPFGTRELRARIKALLRRAAAPAAGDVIRFGDVEVDFGRGELRRAGVTMELTPLEFKLLEVFIRSRGRVLSRESLLDQAWGPQTFASARVVDNHIANLRRKIEVDPAAPRYLLNVRGLGYRFDG